MATMHDPWPELPFAQWVQTCETLHMYTQIVGKIRLSLAPHEREWANVPLYVSARGLTTGAMPYEQDLLQIDFDFIRHSVEIARSDGRERSLALVPARSVAAFHDALISLLREVGVQVAIWPMPVEIPSPIRFSDDHSHASYDAPFVHRFWQALVRMSCVFEEHRARFRGRHTRLQFFWGTFDLAYARFSGVPAEPPPNADSIMRVAMDAQEIATGFWPGNQRFPEPAFFAYTYPAPEGLEGAAIQPATAFWSKEQGLFILRYDDVRSAPEPREVLRAFLNSTYDACATLARWDRSTLE